MRKVFFLLPLIFLSVSVFPGGNREKYDYYLDFGAGYQYASEWQSSDGVDYRSSIHSIAAQMNQYTFRKGKTDGFLGRVAWFIPAAMQVTADGDSESIDPGDYEFIFGMDTMFGWARRIERDKKSTWMLAAGPHIGAWWSKTTGGVFIYPYFISYEYSVFSYSFGVAASGSHILMLGERAYLNSGLQLGYDFYNVTFVSTAYDTTSDSGFLSTLSLNPFIGFGLRY